MSRLKSRLDKVEAALSPPRVFIVENEAEKQALIASGEARPTDTFMPKSPFVIVLDDEDRDPDAFVVRL